MRADGTVLAIRDHHPAIATDWATGSAGQVKIPRAVRSKRNGDQLCMAICKADLIRAHDTGSLPPFLFFWKPDGSVPVLGAECLSQWYPSAFVHEGVEYKTAEHWMMHRKALLFGDHDMAGRILGESRPSRVQQLGRRISGFQLEGWVAARFDIVVQGNLFKFEQSPRLLDFLLSTHPAILVEASPQDRLWGIGLRSDDPEALDPRTWPGDNLLGFALMKVRQHLQSVPPSPGPE